VRSIGVDVLKLMQKKLRESRYFLNLMGKASLWATGDPEVFGFLVSAFLSASRPITDFIENRAHGDWLAKWKDDRTDDEKKLLEFMREQRNSEVHKDGADTRLSIEFVPINTINRGRSEPGSSHYVG
jgi:hypothetical protein